MNELPPPQPISQKEINKRIFFWALYDFANSLANINVSFYFVLWFVSDLGGSDHWVSILIVLSTVLLLFTLPAFGAKSDQIQKRMPFLRAFTALTLAALLGLGVLAINTFVLTPAALMGIAFLYFTYQYFYQASFPFNDPFVQDFAAMGNKHSREFTSGLGMGAGQLGNIVGLLLILPVGERMISIFGATGRPAAFIGAAILFTICVLPTLIFLKDTTPQTVKPQSSEKFIGKSIVSTLKDLRDVKRYPGVLPYLITYYLFADAIITIQIFGTLYLEKVGGIGDTEKNIVFLAFLVLSVIGSFISGWIAKILGGTKRAISIFIGLWVVFLTALALAMHPVVFMLMTMLNGFAFGTLFSLSRAYYSRLVPPEKQGEFFSVYILFERGASILGPVVWSLTVLGFAWLGEAAKYRCALLSLAVLVAISFISFRFVKEPEEYGKERA